VLLAVLIGFAFGFLGSMPVAGPIAVLVLRLGLSNDARRGRYLAMGGALAEGLYVLLAFWGLSAVLGGHPGLLPASRLLGATICLLLGSFLLVHRPAPAAPDPRGEGGGVERRGRKRSFLGGFLLTVLNPTLLVTWTAALAALQATGLVALAPARAIPFAVGVVLGIVAWFSTLLVLAGRFKERWSPGSVARFIKVMGAGLVVAGLWVGARTLLGRTAAPPPPPGDGLPPSGKGTARP
jgi:threonine/homoserine/homoserine lactone efflux protein